MAVSLIEKYGEDLVWQLMQCDFSGECNMNRGESVRKYANNQGFYKLAGWLADKPARYGDLYAEFCAEYSPIWLEETAAPNDSGIAASPAQAPAPAPVQNRFGIRPYMPNEPTAPLLVGVKKP